jgi:hypothetical protein
MNMKRSPDQGRSEMIRRLRLSNLRKLFRNRYGPTLPDDDAGREDLHELLLPISLGPHADIKMSNAIEVWAPWMHEHEASQIIEQINRTPPRQRKPTARQLGKRLQLTNVERERLKLWTIAPHDMSPQQLLEQRKAKAKARMLKLRQLRGSKPQAASNQRKKPWKIEGISRRTWYRRRFQKRGTNSCQVKLPRTEHELVPPVKTPAPQRKRLSNGQHAPRQSFQTKG